jgi:hypothetical protein
VAGLSRSAETVEGSAAGSKSAVTSKNWRFQLSLVSSEHKGEATLVGGHSPVERGRHIGGQPGSSESGGQGEVSHRAPSSVTRGGGRRRKGKGDAIAVNRTQGRLFHVKHDPFLDLA